MFNSGEKLMRAGVIASFVLAGGLFGGCASISQEDYDAALEENSELRQRVASLRSAHEDAERRRAELEMENDELLAAMEEMRAAGRDRADDTGFEGIADVGSGRRGDSVVVDVAGDVLFDSGQAEVRSAARQTLNQVADVLNSRYRNNVIRVEGHSDSDPIRVSGWESNYHLSFERAHAVEQYLIQRGVDGNRMYTAAFGPRRPKGTKRESRRVEIVILAEER